MTTEEQQLINLICSEDKHNRDLALQISFDKEREYPEFYKFINSAWRTACKYKRYQAYQSLTKPLPPRLLDRIEMWDNVVGDVYNTGSEFVFDWFRHNDFDFDRLRVFFGLAKEQFYIASEKLARLPVPPNQVYNLDMSRCSVQDWSSLADFKFKHEWYSGELCIRLNRCNFLHSDIDYLAQSIKGRSKDCLMFRNIRLDISDTPVGGELLSVHDLVSKIYDRDTAIIFIGYGSDKYQAVYYEYKRRMQSFATNK